MFSDILVIVPKQNTLRDSNLYYSVKIIILKFLIGKCQQTFLG